MTPPFFEAEIAISSWCWRPDDHVIHKLEVKDSAGFVDSPCEAEVSL
jgi:hypothetical protein